MHPGYAKGFQRFITIDGISITDESGKPGSTPASQQQHWRRQFTKVLNVRTHSQPAEMEKEMQSEVDRI